MLIVTHEQERMVSKSFALSVENGAQFTTFHGQHYSVNRVGKVLIKKIGLQQQRYNGGVV